MSKAYITEQELLLRLRKQIECSGGQNPFSRHGSVSQSMLSELLSGQKGIGPKTANHLGYEMVRFYRKLP